MIDGRRRSCMAPHSCEMNPAQGSPSTGLMDTLPEDRTNTGTDELQTHDLPPVKRCKSKSLNLPFSVESLIADRAPIRTHCYSEPGLGCVHSKEPVCQSPRELYAEKRHSLGGVADLSDCSEQEVVELSDKEPTPWFQSPYASPPSEFSLSPSSFSASSI